MNCDTIIVTKQKEVVTVKEEICDIIVDASKVIFAKVNIQYDTFSPTNGQTVFSLSQTPVALRLDLSQLYINGQKMQYIASYVVSGTLLTVILPYTLSTNDTVDFYYYY